MRYFKPILLLWALLFFNGLTACFSQINTYDSLLLSLKNANSDSVRITTYFDIADLFEYSSEDTALFWYHKAKDLARSNIRAKTQPLNTYKLLFAESIKSIGTFYYYNGKYEKALEYYDEALSFFTEMQNLNEMAKCYTNIGVVHQEQFRGDEAISWYMKALKIFENSGNKRGTITCLLNIGNVFSVQQEYLKAEEYYLKALDGFQIMKDEFGIATCYNNLGGIYNEMRLFDKSMFFYQKALPIKLKLNDAIGVADIYLNLGNLYYGMNDKDKSLESFKKTLEIGLKHDHRAVLSNAYICIASIYIEQHKIDEGIEMAKKGIQIAREEELIEQLKFGYNHLSTASEMKGDYKTALNYTKMFIWAKDSMESRDRDQFVSELDAKYQTEKRQKQIELQKADIETKQARISQQRTQLLAFISGFILVLLMFLYAFYSYRQKKKANILLAAQKKEIETKNEELNQKNEEILAQRDEIETQRDQILERNEELNQKNEEIQTQRDEIETQKQLLEIKNREVMDSIHYALRIQKAIIPDESVLEKLSSDYFIIFKPKDVVSGDFYWFAKKNKWIFVAVADCTGHGVPGAFMSMLAITYLNEIISREDVITAASTLDELRKYVIKSLHQSHLSGGIENIRDGLDIAFVAINPETLEMQFAGANNPLYIVKTGYYPVFTSSEPLHEVKADLSPETLYEVKGDKQPIGIYENMKPFTNHSIQLNKGDVIYLKSDGYEDQFGGSKGKKFLSKNLKKFILENSVSDMSVQKDKFEQALDNWMKYKDSENTTTYAQVDDITLMGIKII
ncbi:MAG: hypothetical protein A2275_12330 [Bacteroidetes bacterium RIFOXYA12_FULL_35_11]|nr:MAG: hypothetical protein A2X01_02385 [Bacteroidetes bacterium GWF2_35_48]OFY77868.1 MAG: hypothetical protein A2275_12330 [Bacteroidetes bacterium RIFOXYA12_FULL_35_11]